MSSQLNGVTFPNKVDFRRLVTGYIRKHNSTSVPDVIDDLIFSYYPQMNGVSFRWRVNLDQLSESDWKSSHVRYDSDAFDVGLPNQFFLQFSPFVSADPDNSGQNPNGGWSVQDISDHSPRGRTSATHGSSLQPAVPSNHSYSYASDDFAQNTPPLLHVHPLESADQGFGFQQTNDEITNGMQFDAVPAHAQTLQAGVHDNGTEFETGGARFQSMQLQAQQMQMQLNQMQEQQFNNLNSLDNENNLDVNDMSGMTGGGGGDAFGWDDKKNGLKNEVCALSLMSFPLPFNLESVVFHVEFYCVRRDEKKETKSENKSQEDTNGTKDVKTLGKLEKFEKFEKFDAEYSTIWKISNKSGNNGNYNNYNNNGYGGYNNQQSNVGGTKFIAKNWALGLSRDVLGGVHHRPEPRGQLEFEVRVNVLKVKLNNEDRSGGQQYQMMSYNYNGHSPNLTILNDRILGVSNRGVRNFRFVWDLGSIRDKIAGRSNARRLTRHSNVFFDLFELQLVDDQFLIQLCGMPRNTAKMGVKLNLHATCDGSGVLGMHNKLGRIANAAKGRKDIVSSMITFDYDHVTQYLLPSRQNEKLMELIRSGANVRVSCDVTIVLRYDQDDKVLPVLASDAFAYGMNQANGNNENQWNGFQSNQMISNTARNPYNMGWNGNNNMGTNNNNNNNEVNNQANATQTSAADDDAVQTKSNAEDGKEDDTSKDPKQEQKKEATEKGDIDWGVINDEIDESKGKIVGMTQDSFVWQIRDENVVDDLVCDKLKKVEKYDSEVFELLGYQWYVSCVKSFVNNPNAAQNTNNAFGLYQLGPGGQEHGRGQVLRNNGYEDFLLYDSILIYVQCINFVNGECCRLETRLVETDNAREEYYVQSLNGYQTDRRHFKSNQFYLRQKVNALKSMDVRRLTIKVTVSKLDNNDCLLFRYKYPPQMHFDSTSHRKRMESEGMQQVRKWLQDTVGLPEYCRLFETQGIDEMETVQMLEKEHLDEMGIVKLGHKLKLIKHIAAFKKQTQEKQKK